MIRIGIDINQTIRDLNKQINIVWEKKTGKLFCDMDDVANHDLKAELKFDTIQERDDFYFREYCLELFGSAVCCTNFGYVKLNEWILNSTNFLDDEIEFVVFSPFENDMSIKGTLFFLSKFVRCRLFEFPAKAEDMWDKCDIIVTANDKIASSKKFGKDKVLVCIDNPLNKKCQSHADLRYDSMEALVDDLMEFSNLRELLMAKITADLSSVNHEALFDDNITKQIRESIKLEKKEGDEDSKEQ